MTCILDYVSQSLSQPVNFEKQVLTNLKFFYSLLVKQ